MSVYAYQCFACRHLASRHGLAVDGDLVAGPYRCSDCDCEISRDAPVIELSKQAYERFMTGAVVPNLESSPQ